VPPFLASSEATVAVRAQRPDVLPPSLEKSFPIEDLPASRPWGVSTGIGLPGDGVAGQASRVHKIVNGDSLPSLAKRYLGSEDCAGEIFEANRDLLTSPDALPIGVELRIPPRNFPKSTAKHPPDPPLVPIRPRSGPPQHEAGT
jgi:nucleoid-associated protein YgaU